MTVTTRSRHDADIPGLARMLVRVHDHDGYPVEGVADPERWLRHPGAMQSWTAVEGELPVGQITLAHAVPTDDVARIWTELTDGAIDTLAVPVRLFVDPARRGRGAGRLLMESAVSHARERGLAVALDVMLKDRAAIRLYERLGARHVADIAHHHGDGRAEPAAVYVVPT